MASPAGPPPISNPSEDDSTRILAATWTVTSVALVTVITRLYVRFIVIRNWGWDDALMTFAMSMTVAGTAVIAASIHYGAGKHLGDIPLQDLGMGLKLNFISQPIFLISICVVKLAVGASLLRIASTKFYKYLILSIMGFMTFYTIGCFFTLMFQCTDLRVLWDPTVHATCWSQRTLQALSYTNAALNILTDLLFAIIIPTPMLWSLNVHRRTRLTLLFILGLGVFACAASLVKVSYVVNYGKQGDWLWDSRDISIWTVVEDCTGIVAGSLPTLKPLFKRFLGSTYGKGSRRTPGGGYIQNTPKTNKSNWESLSSARRHARDPADETSSERALNTDGDAKQGLDQYEMSVHPGGQGNNWTARTTVVANRDAESSDESLNRLGLAMGITKTTTTTVKSTFK